MTNKKIWAATLFSTLLLTMTISSPVKAAELQTSTTVDRSQITLPLSEETEENLFSLESVSAGLLQSRTRNQNRAMWDGNSRF